MKMSTTRQMPMNKKKPIKIDDFNEAKEKEEIKECIEKQKIKQREVAEKNNV